MSNRLSPLNIESTEQVVRSASRESPVDTEEESPEKRFNAENAKSQADTIRLENDPD
jgi:hypothetical protein